MVGTRSGRIGVSCGVVLIAGSEGERVIRFGSLRRRRADRVDSLYRGAEGFLLLRWRWTGDSRAVDA